MKIIVLFHLLQFCLANHQRNLRSINIIDFSDLFNGLVHDYKVFSITSRVIVFEY